MIMNYRGIKHGVVSAKQPTQPGTVKEVYRGVPLLNRVAKG